MALAKLEKEVKEEGVFPDLTKNGQNAMRVFIQVHLFQNVVLD